MRYIVKNHEELENKIGELVKEGYKQTDITDHELVFTKGLHARDTIFPTFWIANEEIKNKNITIKNLRNETPYQEWQVRVDRSSVLGNPFYMANENERNNVCEQYEKHFNKKIESQDFKFISELKRLKNLLTKYNKLELFCWCYPKRCHAETIKQYLEHN